MKRVVTTFILVFVTWILLTFSFELDSLVVGVALSLTITVITRHFLSSDTPRIIMHPKRWVAFAVYIVMMFYLEVLAHVNVAKRVLTGKTRPAIIEVPVRFRTALGKTLLANSITMTPGTLTVRAKHESKFYVHVLGLKKDMDISRTFNRFGGKVIE